MKRVCALLAIAFFTTSPVIAENTWKAPTAGTLPKRYLKTVPLGISQPELAKVMGLPAKTMDLAGEQLWQYDLRVLASGVEIVQSYTFVFKDEKLMDVRYSSSGNHKNFSAVDLAAEK